MLLFSVCLAPLLVAQDPIKLPRHARIDVPAKLASGLDTVIHDEVEGETWSAADSYKVHFARSGPVFVPFFGSDATTLDPVAFRLKGITVDGRAVACADVPAVRMGDQVHYARGGVTEIYAVKPAGIEQMFRFDKLDTRGEIHVTIAVDTTLEMHRGAEGFEFRGPRGTVRYGEAFAIDADGERLPMETRWQDGSLVLTVPAAFVASARLPLLIDPLISTAQVVASNTRRLEHSDITYDAVLDQFILVYERVFSATDSDLYLLRLDNTMTPTGPAQAVDITTTSWRRCRVAGLTRYQRFLVVAEVSAGNAAPFWIGGRIFAPTEATPMLAPIEIEKDGLQGHLSGNKLHPDVGGDPNPAGPTYFTVVFERAYSQADHDIWFRQITFDGSQRSQTPVPIDNSTAFDSKPTISKSNGNMSAGDQRHAIAFHRRNPGGADSGHIRVATMTWDGTLTSMNGSTSQFVTGAFPLDAGTFRVSSPSDMATGRLFMLAETRKNANQRTDIHGTVFTAQGNVLSNARLTPVTSKSFRSPAVDCDGTRFAVAYVHEFTPAPALDEDVHVMTVSVIGSELVLQDTAAVSNWTSVETGPSIVARRSGRGARSLYGISYSHFLDASTFRIEAIGYRGTGDFDITTRNTGCGGLNVSVSGNSSLGENFTLTLTNGGPLRGFLVGTQANAPLPCVGCVLGTTSVITLNTPTLTIGVPQSPVLVGGIVSFQGFEVALGNCLGTIALSQTVDVRVR